MWRIIGRYRGGEWEEIDTAEHVDDAKYLLGEYRIAFGKDWELMIKKVKAY